MASNDQYYFQYEFTVEILNAGGNPIKPIRIKSVVEDALYHADFFPSLQLIIEINRKEVMSIYRSKLKTFFHITKKVFKYLLVSNVGRDEGIAPELVSQSTEWDDTFVPLFRDEDFPSDVRDDDNENEKHLDGDGVLTQRAMDVMNYTLDVVLYSAKCLAANKDSLMNAVLNKCKVGTALGFMVDASTCDSAIVDKPDNDSEYTDIILLPYNLRNSLWSLQVRYGIFKDSLVAFFDFDCLYILNKFAMTHEFASGDKQYTFCIIHEPPETQLLPVLVKETSDAVEYTMTTEVKRDDPSALAGETEGSSVLVTNYQMSIKSVVSKDGKVTGYNNAATVIGRQSKSHDKSGKKISIEYDEMNNLINLAAFNREHSPHEIVNFKISGASSASIKPNKIFVLEFANVKRQQELGGKYTPVRARCVFTPIGPNVKKMICEVDIHLMSLKEPK